MGVLGDDERFEEAMARTEEIDFPSRGRRIFGMMRAHELRDGDQFAFFSNGGICVITEDPSRPWVWLREGDSPFLRVLRTDDACFQGLNQPRDIGPTTACFDCGAIVAQGEIYISQEHDNKALCPACYEKAESAGRARLKKEKA